MEKKIDKTKQKIPFFSLPWYKEINKVETNVEFIQNQIDKFMDIIADPDQIDVTDYKHELMAFERIIRAKGHVSPLEKEYQEKFFKIAQFIDDYYVPEVAKQHRKWRTWRSKSDEQEKYEEELRELFKNVKKAKKD